MTETPVLDRTDAPQMPIPTPNACLLPRRLADFSSFTEALDYAAKGVRGLNFHDARGNLALAYPYARLRADALAMAYRLIARGVRPGDRIALVAETGTEFAALFCGAIYAGAWPVPLPLPTSVQLPDVVQLLSVAAPVHLKVDRTVRSSRTSTHSQRKERPL